MATSKPTAQGSRKLSFPGFWLELCIILILLGGFAYYLSEAMQLRTPRNPADVGPSAFPKLVAVSAVLCLLLLLIRTVWSALREGMKSRVVIERVIWVALTIAAVLTTAYFYEMTGPIVASALCSLVIIFAGGERRPLILLTVPLGLAAGIYVLFVVLLGVRFY